VLWSINKSITLSMGLSFL